MTQFQKDDFVKDRDGYKGRVMRVTEWRGSTWYDIKFPGGEAVRYDSDLTKLEKREN